MIVADILLVLSAQEPAVQASVLSQFCDEILWNMVIKWEDLFCRSVFDLNSKRVCVYERCQFYFFKPLKCLYSCQIKLYKLFIFFSEIFTTFITVIFQEKTSTLFNLYKGPLCLKLFVIKYRDARIKFFGTDNLHPATASNCI